MSKPSNSHYTFNRLYIPQGSLTSAHCLVPEWYSERDMERGTASCRMSANSTPVVEAGRMVSCTLSTCVSPA